MSRSFPQHSVIALLDSSFRWNDDEAIDADQQPYSLNLRHPVIYGQEVLYAARGQEARSRPAQAGIQFKQSIPAERECQQRIVDIFLDVFAFMRVFILAALKAGQQAL